MKIYTDGQTSRQDSVLLIVIHQRYDLFENLFIGGL